MRTVTTVWAAVLLAGFLGAADDHPVLVYPGYRAEPAPVLDGQPTDGCWSAAPLVGGLTHFGKAEVAAVQTFFRVLADDQALYLAVQCDEPMAGRLVKGSPAQQDDHAAVFREEAIELFVDPTHDHSNYYQIAFSLSGSLYDGRGTDISWNSRTRVATAIGQNGWTAEVAIPWADLGLKQAGAGQVVGLNLCRDRNRGEAPEWTTWSYVENGFHDPVRFGHLVLFPTAAQIGLLSEALRLGDRRGPLQVFGADGFSGASYLALVRDALKRLDATIASLEETRRTEPPDVAEAIRRRIEEAQGTVGPFRQRLESGAAVDAAEWLRADRAMAALSSGLSDAIWQARLKALLSGI